MPGLPRMHHCVKKALLIGVQYSTTLKEVDPVWELRGAHEDPKTVRQLLIEVYDYKPEDITVLIDDPEKQYVWPTRENILAAMRNLVKGAQPGDHFVFSFSGHGSQVVNKDGTEEDGFDETLIPVDAILNAEYNTFEGYIKDDDVRKIIVDSLPSGSRCVMIFDRCHSGIASDLPDAKPLRIPVRYRSAVGLSWFLRNRYYNRHHLSSEPDREAKEIRIIPAKNKFRPCASTIGRGWVPYVHPEGQVYFRFKQYYTNSYLYDEDTLLDLEEAVDVIDRELQKHDDLPESYDVGLETYVDDENDKLACYYIADTVNEEVLWVDECHIDCLVEEEGIPILTLQHLKHAYSCSYWQHMYMFPHGRKFTEERLQNLQAMLTFQLFDRVVSKTSCAPWSEDDLNQLLHVTHRIRPHDSGPISAWGMFIVARLQMMNAADLLQNYSGTKWARIESNRSVHVDVTAEHFAPSWIFTAISWMLFCTPTLYLSRLDEIWLDHNVNQRPWRKFINEIKEDWAATITPSAVILTANVGFLAIQSVDQDGSPAPNRSAGQIVSYISLLLSIGNIVACTILGQQHRPTSHIYASEAVDYLIKRANTRCQTQRLAVIFSIPNAFFVWALLSFSAAILWVGFYETSTATRASVFAILIFTIIFLCLTIQNGEWAVVRTLPVAMKRKLQKIPVRRQTVQTRKLSQPIRAFSDKVRSYTHQASSAPGDQPYGSHMRLRPSPSRMPSPPMRSFRRTSEHGEISEV